MMTDMDMKTSFPYSRARYRFDPATFYGTHRKGPDTPKADT